MIGRILLDSKSIPTAALPVCGYSVLSRELAWFRNSGMDKVILEVDTEATAGAARTLLRREGALVRDVCFEVGKDARRTGEIVIAAGTLLDGDPAWLYRITDSRSLIGDVFPPEGWSHAMARPLVSLRVNDAERARYTVFPGWGVQIRNAQDALNLSCLLLEGSGHIDTNVVPIPGSRRDDDVWVARGAQIHSTAHVRGPAFISSGAVICAGAYVGPRVLVGRDVMVEPGARVGHSILANGVVVGEGLRVGGAYVVGDEIRPFGSEEMNVRIGDALLLDTIAASSEL